MASKGVQASSSSSFPATYHVFLNFMVEELGTKFADHLCTALDQAAFRTFRRDRDLKIGENSDSQLQKAIQESRNSIILFSKGYASSIQCLDELLMILQHKNSCSAQHQVLPVFYDVDPSDVRKQKGSFEEAFRKHEERLEIEEGERKREWKTKVERWRSALTEVANLAGEDLQNQPTGHESNFIQKIINLVDGNESYTSLNFATCLVGMHSRVASIEKWLKDGSTDVGMLAICGMGGSGKTTIARFVYDLNFLRFERRSFLANIAEVSKQQNGIISIQKQLLKDISKGRKVRINNVDEGTRKIKDALQYGRILLVLDDIDEQDQLEALVRERDWLHPGSKIIITTKNEQLMRAHNVKVYKVHLLNLGESLELFSWHAFKNNCPSEQDEEISRRVVEHCEGLPLAIKVLGSSFAGTSKDVWENQLEKLKAIPDGQIFAKLKISYDCLDHFNKDIFLHIACFFVGEDEDYVALILDGCDLHAKVGLQNLIDRCLLTIEEHGHWKNRSKVLRMHNLIQDMGKGIVRQELPKELGRRSRIWGQDSLNILREKTGTKQIEGLIFNLNKFARTNYGGSKPFPYRIADSLKEIALSISPSHLIGAGSTKSNEEPLDTDAFVKMHNLKLLQLNYVYLSGSYERFPKGLRWLYWRGFPLPSIPNDIILERVVILEMPGSNLKYVWSGTKNLQFLKVLDLNGCKSLTSTPNFSFVTNLERLILENCTSLVEIHESIGLLGRLDFLNLRNCSSLGQLPRSIGMLKSLTILKISRCSNLKGFPSEMRKLQSLKKLHANRMRKDEAQSWSWDLFFKPIQSLKLSQSSFPQSLVYLSLKHCHLSDDAFLSDHSIFMSLEELNLSENLIYGFPDCFKDLPKLHLLYLEKCRNLHSITGLRKKNLHIKSGNIGNCSTYEYQLCDVQVDARGCENLIEIEGMFKLEGLNKVDQKIINDLGLLNFGYVRETIHAINRGKKTFCPQVCQSPLFITAPLSKSKDVFCYETLIKQFQESRAFMTYVFGSKIPDWFSFKNRGSNISFIVPTNLDLRIESLTLCFQYVCFSAFAFYFSPELYVSVINRTKMKMWESRSWMIGFQQIEEEEDIMMLNYWNLGGDELTAGDELALSIFILDEDYSIAREIGVQLLYEDKEQEKNSKQSTSEEEEEEEEIPQICTYGKVADIDQCVPIDSRTKLHLPIHLEKPKLKLTINEGFYLTQDPCKEWDLLGFGGRDFLGFGGVIRDEKDMWMVGYYSYASSKSWAYSEVRFKLAGIREGLQIIGQRGWTGVEVEVDSPDLLHLLHGDITLKEYYRKFEEFHEKPCKIQFERRDPEGHPRSVKFIRCLLKRYKCTLSHTPFNQWNQVALQLANMGLRHKPKPKPKLEPVRTTVRGNMAVLEHPPEELGLECLLKGCGETKDEHAQLSTKAIVNTNLPCTHLSYRQRSSWYNGSPWIFCATSRCQLHSAKRGKCLAHNWEALKFIEQIKLCLCD